MSEPHVFHMIDRGPATEDEMIHEFLRAEIVSSRYAAYILGKLALLGVPRSLIDAPDLSHTLENGLRRCLLSYRGYDNRTGLFNRISTRRQVATGQP